MRASFIKGANLSLGELTISGERAKHFTKVLRVKIGEKVLILNGEGESAHGLIKSVQSKEIVFEVKNVEISKQKFNIDIALGIVKKEALEQSLRMSVELGCSKLLLIKSKFSQSLNLKDERVEKILESAYEQSNNPFELEIEKSRELQGVSFNEYEKVLFFESFERQIVEQINHDRKYKKILIIIGPEGGFSDSEYDFLSQLPNSEGIRLPTAIMRSPTALVCAYGHTLNLINLN